MYGHIAEINNKKEKAFSGVRFPGFALPHKRTIKIERWYLYDIEMWKNKRS